MSTIEAIEVTATINPADYRTAWDGPHNAEYRAKQFADGKALAEQGAAIYISVTGSWSARVPVAGRPGEYSHVSAYERLGYHAGTEDLLRGWLAGGARIYDYRASCWCGGAQGAHLTAHIYYRTREDYEASSRIG
jgi:hypothetical protein